MVNRQHLINYHTSGTATPSSGDVKFGEIIVSHDSDTPTLFTLKNNGEFAVFVDEDKVNLKQDKLTAGDGIEISGTTISVNNESEYIKYYDTIEEYNSDTTRLTPNVCFIQENGEVIYNN